MAKMHEAMEREVRRVAAVVTVRGGRVPLPREVVDYVGAGKGRSTSKCRRRFS